MKTTLDLPDELMREVKLRAVREDSKLKDMVAQLLRRGLDASADVRQRPKHRVKLPLIRVAHPAAPGEEMTPERVAQLLIDEEVQRASFG